MTDDTQLTEEQWRLRYAMRIVEVAGFSADEARNAAEAAEFDPEENPEDAADDEMSHWND